MYCLCAAPKIVLNNAMHETFKVCSSGQGGCGKEYKNEVHGNNDMELRPFTDKSITVSLELVKFLHKENVYDKFIYNVNNSKQDENAYIDDLFGAFTWGETPENHGFWSKLSSKFVLDK